MKKQEERLSSFHSFFVILPSYHSPERPVKEEVSFISFAIEEVTEETAKISIVRLVLKSKGVTIIKKQRKF